MLVLSVVTILKVRSKLCQVDKISNLYKNINDHLIIWLPIIFFASFILITEL